MKKVQHSKQQRQQSICKKVSTIKQNQFYDFLSEDVCHQVIKEHTSNTRDRQYSPTTTLSMFIYQMLSEDSSCQNAVNNLNVEKIKSGDSTCSSNTAAYCRARQRLPQGVIEELVRKSGKHLAMNAPKAWLWQSRRVKFADGTTIILPDTLDNQSHFPQHGHQAEGAGFPLVRLVAVLCLSTGGLMDVSMGAFKGKGTGEHSLLRELLDCFEEGDILLADSYYASYFLVTELINRGVDVLFEQHASRKTDFRKGKKQGPRDHIVSWKKPKRPSWMSREEYKSYPESIRMREVKVDKKVLVTTILSKKVASKNELGKLYLLRWHVELDLRNIKTTLGMEMLSCKTAEMCKKELWIYMLGYNVIRILMSEAGAYTGRQTRDISFKHTLQIWLAWVTDSCSVFSRNEHLELLLSLITEIRVGNRPGRVEPRAVKRRPKSYPRLKSPRRIERENIIKYGHTKKMAA